VPQQAPRTVVEECTKQCVIHNREDKPKKEEKGYKNHCLWTGPYYNDNDMFIGLGLGASETEIKIHYRQLARKYHPDKNDHAATGLTTEEATEFFKLLNNANDYLRERA
jgi:hypothetical protein